MSVRLARYWAYGFDFMKTPDYEKEARLLRVHKALDAGDADEHAKERAFYAWLDVWQANRGLGSGPTTDPDKRVAANPADRAEVKRVSDGAEAERGYGSPKRKWDKRAI